MKLIISSILYCLISRVTANNEQFGTEQEIQRLQEYIRIDTSIGYSLDPAVRFWSGLAFNSRLKFSVYEYVKSYPVVVIKWPGKNSTASSVVVNTNMDVIPANVTDGWTYPPFSANVVENSDMYGRGTQGFKSVSLQHFEALCRLNTKKYLTRDFYMVLTPDKETGSKNGLVQFLKSKAFKEMDAGYFFVPGIAALSNEISVLYRGKTRWSFRVECNGTSGASSKPYDSSSLANGPCDCFYESFISYRASQSRLAKKCPDTAATTVINFVGADATPVIGTIPVKVYLYFDAYLALNINFCDFQATVQQWVKEAGKNIKLRSLLLQERCDQDIISNKNPYWTALQKASKTLNIPFNNRTSASPHEAAAIFAAGYPAFGISPLPNTEDLVDAVNERINIRTYLKGITIFEEIFKEVANIPTKQISPDPSDYVKPY